MTRILGIDPGSQCTGVGIIDVDAAGKATHVFHAPLNLLVGDAAAKGNLPGRLKLLLAGLREVIRSEEHTSELQSLMRISYAVFCLKKKKDNTTPHTSEHTRS